MGIADKLFTIDGGEVVGMSSDFRDKVEKIFYEAVDERACEEAYLDGVEDTLQNMREHGIAETAAIVLKNLVDDGILKLDDAENEGGENEGKQNVDEGLSFADVVAGQIG